jgi:hypothetical protein
MTDTPAPQSKPPRGAVSKAKMAVYEAWRTGKPVTVLHQGVTITATADSLVSQLVAEMSAAKIRTAANA